MSAESPPTAEGSQIPVYLRACVHSGAAAPARSLTGELCPSRSSAGGCCEGSKCSSCEPEPTGDGLSYKGQLSKDLPPSKVAAGDNPTPNRKEKEKASSSNDFEESQRLRAQVLQAIPDVNIDPNGAANSGDTSPTQSYSARESTPVDIGTPRTSNTEDTVTNSPDIKSPLRRSESKHQPIVAEMCVFMSPQTGTCGRGDKCKFAHSREQLSACYKTRPCDMYWLNGHCSRGTSCAFYHEASEHRKPPEHHNLAVKQQSDKETVMSEPSRPKSDVKPTPTIDVSSNGLSPAQMLRADACFECPKTQKPELPDTLVGYSLFG